MRKWNAMQYYDEGRLGHIGCVGLNSREEAIAYLQKSWNWKLCWYMLPSWYVYQNDYESYENK